MTFECPTGCGERHSIEYVMCRRCWSKVPREIQSRVYRAWGARRRFPGDERKIAEHESAKRQAIAFVQRKLAA